MDVGEYVRIEKYGVLRVGLFLEVTIMKRYTFALVSFLAVLVAVQIALGQAEREGFRTDMAEMRQRFERMSPEEQEKFRAEMRERFGTRARLLDREQQLEVVAAIQKQLDKLKAAIESIDPETRRRIRDLSAEEQAELRAKTGAAMRDRFSATRAIDQELAKLRMPGRPGPDVPRPDINEWRVIHKLALKEKATETAKRIEDLLARYRGRAPGRERPGQPRPRGDRPERPARPDRPRDADAGREG